MPDASPYIDITMPISERLPVWPGDAPVQILRRLQTPAVSELRLSSHVGTHLDAPAHLFPGGQTVDQLPLERLIGPARVVQVDRAGVITAQILADARIPAGAERLLLKTRNSLPSFAHPGRKPVLLTHKQQHSGQRPFDPHFVALDATAAEWLLAHQVRLVGIDGPSVDPFSSKELVAHSLLLAGGVIVVENLLLRDAAPGPYRLLCLPLRYEGGDGAPVRAVLESLSNQEH